MTPNPITPQQAEPPPGHTGSRLYFNGYQVVLQPGDVTITLLNNNEPVVALQATHILAKSLANSMLQVCDKYEQAIGQRIMTIEELNQILTKPSE